MSLFYKQFTIHHSYQLVHGLQNYGGHTVATICQSWSYGKHLWFSAYLENTEPDWYWQFCKCQCDISSTILKGLQQPCSDQRSLSACLKSFTNTLSEFSTAFSRMDDTSLVTNFIYQSILKRNQYQLAIKKIWIGSSHTIPSHLYIQGATSIIYHWWGSSLMVGKLF